ncbi:conserved hypothetical protein [Hyella patelloides LEGE 07179]|uniref:Nitroreductase domain-containing protein n=1 Tax=Hyella patelloides LEGE 07179 TaxID=945734 RepID=A0A563VQV1_9CYAN|nr:nitroreductase family protein [Hyella patelloides]VEP13842.1 conserved hypothetical protein [Hyella patelloides LEGE 07179]
MENLRKGIQSSVTNAFQGLLDCQERDLKFLIRQFVRKAIAPKVRHNLYHHWWSPLKKWQRRIMFMPNFIANYVYDLKRFLRSSSANNKVNTQTQLRALITMDYHRIEKGLALKEPRVGFGQEVIQRLLLNLPKYIEKYSFDETAQITLNSLFAYYNFNLEHGFKYDLLDRALIELRDKISSQEDITDRGGIIKISKQSILKEAQHDLQNFFQSRYSIRHFAPDEVDIQLIEQAVRMAQKTPSVCNRQSSQVYVFSKDEDKRKVLSYQNGNRGFGEQVSKVLVVVSDLENFTKIGERNQCWIDGGMYAMSLVYALHSLGLGTCCLNWSVERYVDRAFKKATGIKDSESVIMMIAVGHLPEELNVAQSPRKNVHEVLVVK